MKVRDSYVLLEALAQWATNTIKIDENVYCVHILANKSISLCIYDDSEAHMRKNVEKRKRRKEGKMQSLTIFAVFFVWRSVLFF